MPRAGATLRCGLRRLLQLRERDDATVAGLVEPDDRGEPAPVEKHRAAPIDRDDIAVLRLWGGDVHPFRQREDAPGELRGNVRRSSREPMHKRRSTGPASLSGRRSSCSRRRSVVRRWRGYATPAVRAAQPLSVTRTRGERGRSDACAGVCHPARTASRRLAERGNGSAAPLPGGVTPEPQTATTVDRFPNGAVNAV
jgi:hypothetical protein